MAKTVSSNLFLRKPKTIGKLRLTRLEGIRVATLRREKSQKNFQSVAGHGFGP